MKADTFRAINSSLDFAYDPSSIILLTAAEKLKDNHWIKGETATAYNNDGEVRRYDLIGVLISVTGFEIHEQTFRNNDGSFRGISPSERRMRNSWQKKRSNYELWSNTLSRKARQGYLRCLTYLIDAVGWADLEQWNDEMAHSKEDVVDALIRAGDLASGDE